MKIFVKTTFLALLLFCAIGTIQAIKYYNLLLNTYYGNLGFLELRKHKLTINEFALYGIQKYDKSGTTTKLTTPNACKSPILHNFESPTTIETPNPNDTPTENPKPTDTQASLPNTDAKPPRNAHDGAYGSLPRTNSSSTKALPQPLVIRANDSPLPNYQQPPVTWQPYPIQQIFFSDNSSFNMPFYY